jgi:hypothetical protein
MLLETKFIFSLVLTLIIEIPILIFLYRIIFQLKKQSLLKLFVVGFLASALTLPYLWFVLPFYINTIYYIYIGEILVFLVEALIYYEFLEIKLKKALIISFIANIITAMMSFVF